MHDRDGSELTLVSRAERRFPSRVTLRSVTVVLPSSRGEGSARLEHLDLVAG